MGGKEESRPEQHDPARALHAVTLAQHCVVRRSMHTPLVPLGDPHHVQSARLTQSDRENPSHAAAQEVADHTATAMRTIQRDPALLMWFEFGGLFISCSTVQGMQ